MILIAGVATEPPVALALEAAREAGIAHLLFDQRTILTADIALDFDPERGWSGTLSRDGERIALGDLDGVYLRLMDEGIFPDVAALADDDPARARLRDLSLLLHAWFDVAPGRVANRPRAMMSNMSKTYQAVTIRAAGFSVPETLVSNDPEQVLAFAAACARDGDTLVYKSVSGTRSVVQAFGEQDKEKLARIRWCPTQFQRRVAGTDVRVHVIGDRLFPTRIDSEAVDYRYAMQQTGVDAELSETGLPDRVAEACVALAAQLGLSFAGIDLRQTPDDEYYCFEVNPCPAYSYYERRTGAPIARALVNWLAGGI